MCCVSCVVSRVLCLVRCVSCVVSRVLCLVSCVVSCPFVAGSVHAGVSGPVCRSLLTVKPSGIQLFGDLLSARETGQPVPPLVRFYTAGRFGRIYDITSFFFVLST